MSDNHIDYLEQLFQGVDILIERKLKDVSYDTTIVCTITDDSDSKNGKYQVTDGTIRFDVYSDSDKYKVNDQVRVSVANSDYSDTKYIVGKHVVDNSTAPMTYVSPLDTIVNITGNLVPANKQNVSITANKSDKSVVDIWTTSLADGRFADLQTNGIYSAITLKADFKTLLHSYNVKSGTYGLRLILLVKPSKNSASCIAKTAELSSAEMFGNPYAFSISTEQTKIFDIGTEGLITNVALQLYQNNDFIDVNGNSIPISLTDNIIVSNIEFGFGSDLVAIGDNTVKIYTESDSVYKYQGHTPAPYDKKLGYPNQLNADTNLKSLGVLWYNKNDLNEYVGFSDGIYDPTYDEIKYLDEAAEDTRLTAHIGRDFVPTDKESLELAANIEEAKPLIESASKVVTQDLITMLRALKSQFEEIDEISDAIDTAITTLKDKMTDKDDAVKYLLSKMMTQYADILKYGSKKQNNENPTWSEYWTSVNSVNYGAAIKNAFADVRKAINTTLLEQAIAPKVAANGAYSGYAGVYDTYKIRLEKVLASMDLYLDSESKHRFPISVFNGDFNKLKAYETKTSWKSYVKKDLKAYDNKYCIYWFRYEKDYVSDEIHQFMPNGWHRLDSTWEEYGYKVPVNSSVPTTINNPDTRPQIDGKTYNDKRLPPGEGLFNIMMRHNEPEERFVAIIFHNHNMYKSDELVFKNADRIPETANIETGDLLIFKHPQGGKSRNDYQCYNLTNYIMDSADASHIRQIQVHYDGLLHGDEALVGGGLYWYVPTTATMLTFDLEGLKSKGFVSDHVIEDGKPVRIDKVKAADQRKAAPSYSKDGYACFYKQVHAVKDEDTGEYNFVNNSQIDSRDFWYKIKPYYDATASINSIKCEFRPAEDNDLVTGEEFFTFGIMGSNGTKYTLAITPATNQVATTPSKELVLDISLRDFNNEEIDIIKGQTGDGSATGLQTSWLYKYMGNGAPETIGDNPVTGLKIQKASCGIVKATVNFSLSKEAEEETSGNVPITKKRTVQLETVRAIPWAAGNYYISGPTSIVYNSLGTIDNMSMFDNPYKLYALTDVTVNGTEYKINQEIDVSWERTIHKNEAMTEDEKTFYEQYMPVVNDAGGLTPAPMYLDQLDCYMIVHAYTGSGNNKNYLFHQPVIITQNRFGSSVLNDWDGSLTIDEKNGTILSTMIGAGRKTIQNTFEGVLMGDVAVGSNSDIGFEQNNDIGISNHTGLGIYGFHDGAQSFGFNIDGTAFLGKAGRGRIIFNGNNGVIASSNWFLNGGKIRKGLPGENETWIESYGTDGMCIDLENGHIDSYNFKLTSKDIYLNSNPQDDPDYYFRIGHTETEEGDLPSSGLLTFDKYGHLILQADRFTLNGNFGGTNILLNTAPAKYLGDNGGDSTSTNPTTGATHTNSTTGWMWDFEPWTPTNIISITDDTDEVKLSIFNITTKSGISQTIEDIKVGEEYTASVYVYPKEGQTITMSTLGGTVTSTKTKVWEYLTLVFTAEENDKITFSASSDGFKFWHPKVEEGTVATTWGASPKDTVKAQERANAMFTQDNMWSVLSNNGAMQGAWLINGNYYINASFISAGAIMSANWKTSGGTIADDGSITNYGTAGSAFSLKTGELHAAKFHLIAGTSGKLVLNSDPGVNTPYLYVGNNSNYISFKRTDEAGNTSLAITSKIFTLTAGSTDKDIIINSQAPDSGYPLSLGGGNFKVSWGGILNAKGALIEGTITGSEIYIPNKTSPKFSVTSAGVLSATGATLTTLTVNNSLDIAKGTGTGSLSVAGNTTISGTSQLTGAVTIGASDNKTSLTINGTNVITGKTTIGSKTANANLDLYGNIKIAGELNIYCGTDITGTPVVKVIKTGTAADGSGSGLWLTSDFLVINASQRSYIGLDGTHTCHMNGTLLAQGDFYYSGAIYCTTFSDKDKGKKKGVSGSIYYTSGGFWGGKVKEAKFINGILVDADTSASSEDTDNDISLPGIANNQNKFLRVNSTATSTEWSDLPAATTSAYGTVKVAGVNTSAITTSQTSTASRYYGVQMDKNGKLFVNVPWTDTNTTYTQGTGIKIENGVISCTVTAPTSVSYATTAGTATYCTRSGKTDGSNAQAYVATIGTDSTGYVYRGKSHSSLATTSSSLKYKEKIQTLHKDETDLLYLLTPKSFMFKPDCAIDTNQLRRYGFIAEEVEELAKNLATYDDNGELEGVHYHSILTLAVAEIQKLRKELDDLKSNLNI